MFRWTQWIHFLIDLCRRCPILYEQCIWNWRSTQAFHIWLNMHAFFGLYDLCENHLQAVKFLDHKLEKTTLIISNSVFNPIHLTDLHRYFSALWLHRFLGTIFLIPSSSVSTRKKNSRFIKFRSQKIIFIFRSTLSYWFTDLGYVIVCQWH